MDVQARIPPALGALHNYITEHDPDDIIDLADSDDAFPGIRVGELAQGPPDRQSRARAGSRRDEIAQSMWESYQRLQQERGNAG